MLLLFMIYYWMACVVGQEDVTCYVVPRLGGCGDTGKEIATSTTTATYPIVLRERTLKTNCKNDFERIKVL